MSMDVNWLKKRVEELEKENQDYKQKLEFYLKPKQNYKPWTLNEIKYVKENHGKIKIEEIAEKLNRSRNSVAGKLNRLGLVIDRNNIEYAVYKGENMIVMGTAKECAEELGVSVDYILWLTTPSAKKKAENRVDPNNATVAVRLDDDEEDIG